MSYNSMSQCRWDLSFQRRVTASVAQEGRTDAEVAAGLIMWPVCTRSDIEAAYASALASGNPNPGGDEAVISDGMILGAVQQELAALPPA